MLNRMRFEDYVSLSSLFMVMYLGVVWSLVGAVTKAKTVRSCLKCSNQRGICSIAKVKAIVGGSTLCTLIAAKYWPRACQSQVELSHRVGADSELKHKT